MSKSKKEKKLKQKTKIENIIKEDEIKFDILHLLKNERIDSKPNLGKFLKEYVKGIRVFNSNKINMYPVFGYEISKIFVKFLDGHELIMDCHANKSEGFETPEFFLYYFCDEVKINDKKDIECIDTFFKFIREFKFVF